MSQSVPDFAYRWRGMLVSIPLVVGIFTTWREYENAVVTWTVAGVVFAIGLGIRIWSQQRLHYRLQAKTILTTTGPYVLARNPIYIANTLICLALTVASEKLWLLPITLLNCCLVFHFVVQHEERVLANAYGDKYAEFQKQVPRWLPRLSALSKLSWSPNFLGASVKAEAYNLLFLVPMIVKELIEKSA